MNGNQNEEEIFKECMRKLELGKLANEGNIYAIHQQNVDKTGLGVNFEALLPKPKCNHVAEVFKGKFQRRYSIVTSREDGFIIREKICTFCGETFEIRIHKPKRPQRGF